MQVRAAADTLGASLDDAIRGAETCTHGELAVTRRALDLGTSEHGAASTLIAHTPVAPPVDRSRSGVRSILPVPEEKLREVQARGREVRDHLADVFDPLMHDLTRATRALRERPLRDVPLGGSLETLAWEGGTMTQTAQSVVGLQPNGQTFTRAIIRGPRDGMDTESGVQVDVPVGEYGPAMARAQAKAALAMQQIVADRLGADAAAVGALTRPLLNEWTFQGDNVSNSLMEGITSIAQATALATARRVPAMDGPALLDSLATSAVMDRLAHSPMGFVAPLARAGWIPDQAVKVGPNGVLRLGDDVERLLATTGKHRLTHAAPANTTRAGCPVSLPHRSVELPDGTTSAAERTMLADLSVEYLALTKRYLAEEPDAATITPALELLHPPYRS